MTKDLSWLLWPHDPSEFIVEHFDRFPLHIIHADPSYFHTLLCEEQIAELLNDAQQSSFLRVNIKHPDGVVDDQQYRHWNKIENVKVCSGIKLQVLESALFKHGATLTIDNVGRSFPSLEELYEQLVEFFQCEVRANITVRSTNAANFQPSFDVFDQLILQTSGTQRVRIYSPVIERPLAIHGKRAFTTSDIHMVLESEVRQGDALYIPRGFIFQMLSGEELSCQASFQMYKTTWAKVLCDSVHALGSKVNLLREGFAVASLRGDDKEYLLNEIKASLHDALSEGIMPSPRKSKKLNKPFVQEQIAKTSAASKH